MFGIGGSEIIFIALFALLLFGPSRLPELARSMAGAYREFLRIRSHMNDAVDELRADIDIDLDERASKVPAIRPPSATRFNAAGEEHAGGTDAGPLIELDVPEEDDYLDPARQTGAAESQ